MQHAWQTHHDIHLHGWVYDLHTGYINDLLMLPPGTHIDDIHQMEFDDVTPE